jgi:DNA-binding HxlR family transcriptional regulator
VLDHVAGRWGILALVALTEKPMRFSELRRKVDGVSDKMLSQAMQALERDGLVIRDQKSDIPPVVEYSITESGMSVGKAADAFLEALMNNMDQVRKDQAKFDS